MAQFQGLMQQLQPELSQYVEKFDLTAPVPWCPHLVSLLHVTRAQACHLLWLQQVLEQLLPQQGTSQEQLLPQCIPQEQQQQQQGHGERRQQLLPATAPISAYAGHHASHARQQQVEGLQGLLEGAVVTYLHDCQGPGATGGGPRQTPGCPCCCRGWLMGRVAEAQALWAVPIEASMQPSNKQQAAAPPLLKLHPCGDIQQHSPVGSSSGCSSSGLVVGLQDLAGLAPSNPHVLHDLSCLLACSAEEGKWPPLTRLQVLRTVIRLHRCMQCCQTLAEFKTQRQQAPAVSSSSAAVPPPPPPPSKSDMRRRVLEVLCAPVPAAVVQQVCDALACACHGGGSKEAQQLQARAAEAWRRLVHSRQLQESAAAVPAHNPLPPSQPRGPAASASSPEAPGKRQRVGEGVDVDLDLDLSAAHGSGSAPGRGTSLQGPAACVPGSSSAVAAVISLSTSGAKAGRAAPCPGLSLPSSSMEEGEVAPSASAPGPGPTKRLMTVKVAHSSSFAAGLHTMIKAAAAKRAASGHDARAGASSSCAGTPTSQAGQRQLPHARALTPQSSRSRHTPIVFDPSVASPSHSLSATASPLAPGTTSCAGAGAATPPAKAGQGQGQALKPSKHQPIVFQQPPPPTDPPLLGGPSKKHKKPITDPSAPSDPQGPLQLHEAGYLTARHLLNGLQNDKLRSFEMRVFRHLQDREGSMPCAVSHVVQQVAADRSIDGMIDARSVLLHRAAMSDRAAPERRMVKVDAACEMVVMLYSGWECALLQAHNDESELVARRDEYDRYADLLVDFIRTQQRQPAAGYRGAGAGRAIDLSCVRNDLPLPARILRAVKAPQFYEQYGHLFWVDWQAKLIGLVVDEEAPAAARGGRGRGRGSDWGYQRQGVVQHHMYGSVPVPMVGYAVSTVDSSCWVAPLLNSVLRRF